MKSTIKYGTSSIQFEWQYDDRKTLGIHVHPDRKVYVKAPAGTPIELIREKVKKKAAWIQRQQEFFLSFHPLTPPRRYISGETHLYLGRQYRLKVILSDLEEVKLKHGYIHVYTAGKTNSSQIQRLLNDWYAAKAELHFDKLFQRLLPITNSFYQDEVHLRQRWMKKRWGSCSAQGVITLNIELIKAPKRCIEYVIIHEFCHLAYLNHSKAFYDLLEEKLPDWRSTKYFLEHFMV